MSDDRARDPDCLFCRIVAGEIPSTMVHADDLVVAIRDIAPRAPTHVLFLPRAHIPSAARADRGRRTAARPAVRGRGRLSPGTRASPNGYRLVTNIGDWGGQTVDHLHVHLLGGRSMTWPPG